MKHTIHLLTKLVLGLSILTGLATDVAAQDTPLGKQPQTKNAPEKPVFLRIDREGKEPRALQVAIARYEILAGPNQGATVDLVGAVHVGTKQYYSDLNQRFRSYDAVLYELVADPEVNKPSQRAEGGFNPIGGLQKGMKGALELSFQLDEVDYNPKNFVHADMSPTEFGEDMKKRNDGFLGMFARMMGAGFATQSTKKGQEQQAEMLAAMLSKDPMKMLSNSKPWKVKWLDLPTKMAKVRCLQSEIEKPSRS
jgi:hypothetical protein